MKKYAIIAAGGSGQRMGSEVPKQFLEINGKALLWYSVNAFKKAFENITIIIVAPADHLERTKQICSGFGQVLFVKGGESRFHSVKNGLGEVKEDSIVFVHDAVRCLVPVELLRRSYEQAMKLGSAIPSIAIHDSIRMMEHGAHKVIDRNNIRIIQTPQVFKSEILLPAFEAAYDQSFTDEATVVEASGQEVHLIEGEVTNIKITRPVDLLIAEKILGQQTNA